MVLDDGFLRDCINRVFPEVIKVRRDFHMWPELGFQEIRTQARIVEILSSLGMPVKQGIAKTGVIGLLTGRKKEVSLHDKEKVIAFRADIDALPVTEDTGLEFSSKNPGVMHACGHDFHAAILLGAAMVLSLLTEHFSGHVKFIFQPAEENLGGGKSLVQEGGLRSPDVDCVFGFHVWPSVPYGKVAIRPGPTMAAVDTFEIEVMGKGGHGASPQDTVDAIVIGAEIVTAIQTIVSRSVDPISPAVVTVGTFHGGTSSNIIADKVLITGTVRSLTEEIQEKIANRLKVICSGIADAYGSSCNVSYTKTYPLLANSSECVEMVKEVAVDVVGSGNVMELEFPFMSSEDFSFYAEQVPAAYFFLGVGTEGMAPLHSPRFSPPEDIMYQGIELLVKLALRYLSVGLHS